MRMKRDLRRSKFRTLVRHAVVGLSLMSSLLLPSQADAQEQGPEYPPFDKVVEGFTKVESKSPDRGALCKLWTREKDGRLLSTLRLRLHLGQLSLHYCQLTLLLRNLQLLRTQHGIDRLDRGIDGTNISNQPFRF